MAKYVREVFQKNYGNFYWQLPFSVSPPPLIGTNFHPFFTPLYSLAIFVNVIWKARCAVHSKCNNGPGPTIRKASL